jgi:hydrogenase/urease accessory protein HupE
MSRALRLLLLTLAGLFAQAAAAHEISMAEMSVRETAPGEFMWQWGPGEKRAPESELTARWPDGCQVGEGVLHCGKDGLKGTLQVDGVGKTFSAAMIKVSWLDGQSRVYTFTTSQTQTHLYGSADDQRGMGEIASAYVVLGVEHILSGFDHLAFVLSLLFLVGFKRQLLMTITAFTLAHSLTLALSSLGWLSLRSPPVEASIALSIMLVASEALNSERTLTRRLPSLVAFVFGLVHGLGFAGALKEIGLPQQHLFVALLTFNVGVEIGQLLVIGLVFALYRAVARFPQTALARTPALYAIGSVAAFWSIGRIVAILS